MSFTFVSAKNPAFETGLEIGGHAVRVNDLLAGLEADTATPAIVLELVKSAYVSLNAAALVLLEQAIAAGKAKGHCSDVVEQAEGGATARTWVPKVAVLAGIRLAAHDCTAQGNQQAANELLDIRAAVAELIEAAREAVTDVATLGMTTPRLTNALASVGGAA